MGFSTSTGAHSTVPVVKLISMLPQTSKKQKRIVVQGEIILYIML